MIKLTPLLVVTLLLLGSIYYVVANEQRLDEFVKVVCFLGCPLLLMLDLSWNSKVVQSLWLIICVMFLLQFGGVIALLVQGLNMPNYADSMVLSLVFLEATILVGQCVKWVQKPDKIESVDVREQKSN